MDSRVFAFAAVFGVIGLISLGLGLVMYIFLIPFHPGQAGYPAPRPCLGARMWRPVDHGQPGGSICIFHRRQDQIPA